MIYNIPDARTPANPTAIAVMYFVLFFLSTSLFLSSNVDGIDTHNDNSARNSSYSSRERVIDQVADPSSSSEAEQTSSVVTPTATDYTFLPKQEDRCNGTSRCPEGEIFSSLNGSKDAACMVVYLVVSDVEY